MIKDTLKSILSVIPRQLRLRPAYRKYYSIIKDSVEWSPEELKRKQLIELRRLVFLAYTNTKGYRQLYKEHGVQPSDIQSLEDIKNLPTVNKDILSNNIKDFSLVGPQHRYNTTGGTTGEPFGFYLSGKIFAAEAAFIHAYWEAYKWDLNSKSVVLRGSYVGKNNKFTKYSNFSKELFFSAYHLTEKNFEEFEQKYQKYQPRYIQAYPSAMSLFCDLIEASGKNNFKFHAIFLASENIYPWQIENIKKVFPNSHIHSWYGQAEKCAYATLIPNSNLQYEVQPMYGIVEPGQSNENGMSEIIATGFINTSTPFIRYETNDYAKFTTERHKNCLYQSSTILEKIDGREQEVVITKSGKYLSMTSFSIHDGLFEPIKQFQIQQKKQGEIFFKYVPKNNIPDAELTIISDSLHARFEEDLDIHFERVNQIDRTHSGKFRYLVQELDIKYNLS